jgi:hypothetical protein
METYGKPGFEAKPQTRKDKVENKGEIYFPEKHPANPLKDDASKMMSHRGGLASNRTEHY